jgi:hypothetical protein
MNKASKIILFSFSMKNGLFIESKALHTSSTCDCIVHLVFVYVFRPISNFGYNRLSVVYRFQVQVIHTILKEKEKMLALVASDELLDGADTILLLLLIDF